MTGVDSFCLNAAKVILGADSPAIKEDRVRNMKYLKLLLLFFFFKKLYIYLFVK